MQAEASTQKVRAGCRGIHRAGTWPRTYLHDAYQQEVAVRWAMALLKDVLEVEVRTKSNFNLIALGVGAAMVNLRGGVLLRCGMGVGGGDIR